jgi:elongation factor G
MPDELVDTITEGWSEMVASFAVEIAIEPRNRVDRPALTSALTSLLKRDPALGALDDGETGRIVIRGTDESQLGSAVERLRRDVGLPLDVGAPQASYRESLAKKVDVDYTHKKQSGGSGQFGRIKFTVEPGKCGQGVIFKNEVKGGNVPEEYIPSVEKGIREIAATGSLTGFPIIDFTATLYDGAYHDLDSSVLAFEITGRGGMREAALRAGIKLLEPIMKVVVLTPNRWLDRIVAGLSDRRAELEYQSKGDLCIVVALAPMAQLFGYEAALVSASEDEARSTMLIDHYGEVPPGILFPDDTFPAAAALRA